MEFSTTNLYLASYLYALDVSAFIGLRGESNSYQEFVFKSEVNSRKAIEVEREYWNNGGSVVPKVYATAIRALKEQIRRPL
jgi:hypothetical protein